MQEQAFFIPSMKEPIGLTTGRIPSYARYMPEDKIEPEKVNEATKQHIAPKDYKQLREYVVPEVGEPALSKDETHGQKVIQEFVDANKDDKTKEKINVLARLVTVL